MHGAKPSPTNISSQKVLQSEYGSEQTLAEFKKDLREQHHILLLDERRALDAIPSMLKGHEGQGPKLLEAIRRIVSADGIVIEESSRRLEEVERLFAPGKSGRRASAKKARAKTK
jgi:hypothetical protein